MDSFDREQHVLTKVPLRNVVSLVLFAIEYGYPTDKVLSEDQYSVCLHINNVLDNLSAICFACIFCNVY